MLISQFISDENAKLQFGVLAWLTKKYGPPKKPKVPSPLCKPKQPFELFYSTDSKTNVHKWAQDHFIEIKQQCGMEHWSIQLVRCSQNLSSSRRMLSTHNWNINSKEPYFVDSYGRPIIFYDPSKCTTAGYFASRVITKLAEIKLLNYPLEIAVTPLQSKIMILTAACYMGQGFSVSAMLKQKTFNFWDEELSTKTLQRVSARSLVFSTCLALLSQKQTPEQIVATYGTIMSKDFRRKVRPACYQVNSYDTELDILKILANPKHEIFERPSLAATA